MCPPVNLDVNLDAPNLNMITCGGQATVPVVAAVAAVVPVPYAEIVSSVASRSAGPGTRANIDEFTQTTATALEQIGGAARGKAIILLNPVEPPMIMRNTVFCAIPAEAAEPGPVQDQVTASHPRHGRDGARLRARLHAAGRAAVRPARRRGGAGWPGSGCSWRSAAAATTCPTTPGNLDIMTAAAARVGDLLGAHLSGAAA